MPRSTKLVVCAFVALLLVCFSPLAAFATSQHAKNRLTWDFDGDHHTDLAIGAVQGSKFTIRVQFSSGLDRVVLNTDVGGRIPPHLVATDVDEDNDIDLVLTGISFRPLAVWFNEGNGRFRQSSRWFFPPLYDRVAEQIGHAHSKGEGEPAYTIYWSPLCLPVAVSIRLSPPVQECSFAPTPLSIASSCCGSIFSRGPPIL